MQKRIMFISLLAGLLLLIMAPASVFGGTATGSANSGKGGGQNCAKISKSSKTTGAMTVTAVYVGGKRFTAGTDYTVRRGTSNSTRPIIDFNSPLAKDVKVEVELSTVKDGDFTVNVSLETCKK